MTNPEELDPAVRVKLFMLQNGYVALNGRTDISKGYGLTAALAEQMLGIGGLGQIMEECTQRGEMVREEITAFPQFGPYPQNHYLLSPEHSPHCEKIKRMLGL